MWIDQRGSVVLDPPECKRLLATAAKLELVGRIGVATDQAPVVLPVNFTVHDGQIQARIGSGFLADAADNTLVAFEVDRVDPDGGAWSVLVRGLATVISSPTGAELDLAATPLVPEPGDHVLVVRPDLLTGRRFELRHDDG